MPSSTCYTSCRRSAPVFRSSAWSHRQTKENGTCLSIWHFQIFHFRPTICLSTSTCLERHLRLHCLTNGYTDLWTLLLWTLALRILVHCHPLTVHFTMQSDLKWNSRDEGLIIWTVETVKPSSTQCYHLERNSDSSFHVMDKVCGTASDVLLDVETLM